MKKINITVLFVLFTSSISFSQNWPVVLGDDQNILSYSITEDYDKGLLISSYLLKNSSTTKQGILIKTDVNGNTLWQKSFGTGEYPFDLWKVYKTKDEGTILCGSTAKYDNGYYDPFYVKLNTCNEIVWCTVLHSELGSGDDYGRGIIELADGSFIGMIKYYGHQIQTIRISLVKLNPDGEPVWIEHLAQDDSTVYNEEGYDLILTSDSNYLVAGHRNGGSQPYFIMCDTLGNEEWALSWDKTDILAGSIDEVIEKDSGIFYAVGGGVSPGYPLNPLLVKFDKDGNELYHKAILGDTIKGGGGGPFTAMNDTIFAIGYNWAPGPNTNYGFSGIATTDTLGNIINRRTLVEQIIEPTNIIKTHDGKIIVTGHYFLDNNWDVYLWKMNMQLEDDTLYTQPMIYDSLCPGEIVSDTLDLDCGIYVNIDEIPTREEYENPLKVFPNPADKQIHIKVEPGQGKVIKVFDEYGREKTKFVIPVTGELVLDCSTWPKGLYLFSLFKQEKFVRSAKVIVQ